MIDLQKLFEQCNFKVEVHTICKETREFNYLDGLLYYGAQEFRFWCDLCDVKGVLGVSNLMRAFEETRGKIFHAVIGEDHYKVKFDFKDDYEPYFEILGGWDGIYD